MVITNQSSPFDYYEARKTTIRAQEPQEELLYKAPTLFISVSTLSQAVSATHYCAIIVQTIGLGVSLLHGAQLAPSSFNNDGVNGT